MAGRGPARRPTGATADKRNGVQPLDVRPDGSLEKPRAPSGLKAQVKRQWDDLWAADVAVLLQRSDLAAIRRLFLLYQEREDCHEQVQRTHQQRVPLKTALELGLTGELQHEIDDDGATHTFVVVRHDGRVSIGSQGQMVLSPWARDLRTIDGEIRQLEDRFGLNVRARGALAVAARQPPAPPAPPAPGASGPAEVDLDLLDL